MRQQQVTHTRRSGSRLLTRRRLLAAIGGGALAAGAVGSAIPAALGRQIDASPPAAAPVVGPGAVAPSVADQAAALDYDVAKIFRFVADEIAYSPYSGALRGATGTLWARAGNSVDKALLLGALLDEALVTYRFATGPLDDAAATSLLATSAIDAASAQQRWTASIDAMLAGANGAATPQATTLTPAEERQLQQQIDAAQALNDQAGQLLKRRVTTISEALSQAGVTLSPMPAPALPPAEHEQHTWIQMADGPAWVDLDPSHAGAKQGEALAKAASTGPLPDSVHHKVRFSVQVEEVTGGQPQKREVTAFELTSAELVNVPVCLLVVPPAAMKGIGNAIDQAMSGKSKLVPTYFTGRGGSYSDSTIVFGSGGETAQSALGGTPVPGSAAEGETLAIWSVIDITSPDRDPVHIERTLLDRIGPEARASGKIDLTQLAPVEFVSDSGQTGIKQLQAMWIYSVDTAHYPAVLAGIDPISARIFGGMQLMPQAYPTIRASVSLTHEATLGYQSDVHTPSVAGFTVDLSGPTGAVRSDLLAQDLVVTPLRGSAAPPVHPLLAAGVGNQIAEQLLFTQVGSGSGTATPPAANVQVNDASTVFAAVEKAGTTWKAVKSAGQLGAFGLSGRALVRVKALLDAGMVVVLPEHPVQSSGATRWAWWVVDPRTGRAYDQFEDGSGSAGRPLPAGRPLAVEFEEDTVTDLIPYGAVERYRRLAGCVAAIVGIVSGLLGAVAGGYGAASSTGVARTGAIIGGVGGAVGAGGSAAGAFAACGG